MAELLLDTTYLLPVFGISVGLKGFEFKFDRVLGRFSVLYNPVSLIEAKWAVLKGIRDDRSKKGALLDSYRTGLKILESDGRLEPTPLTGDVVERTADELQEAGLKDYFDRMIYATASERGCVLLTEDREMLRLRTDAEQKPSEVIDWNRLAVRDR